VNAPRRNDDITTTVPKRSSSSSSSSNTIKPSKKTNQLRIIGGQWRGRKLAIADVEGLRPTGDRIRETLFNWLQGDIAGRCCVDLFAGSGALGLECLSRGAANVFLLEKHPVAVKQLREHCDRLEAKNGKVIECDVLEWISNTSKEDNRKIAPIDVAFIDPPFAADLWTTVINTLESSGILSPTAIIYIESPKDQVVTTPSNWDLLKEKRTGQVCYRLFQRQSVTNEQP
jgi:16S rRNA (guanine966-N2)-methyltransferase